MGYNGNVIFIEDSLHLSTYLCLYQVLCIKIDSVSLFLETIMIPDTVLIRHLPSSLSHKEKSGLLQHFGALDVKILGPESRKTNLVYAR